MSELLECADRVKAALVASIVFAYMADPAPPNTRTVEIMKYEHNKLPDFLNYAIIIEPYSETEIHTSVNGIQLQWKMRLIAVVRNFDPVLSFSGKVSPNIGIVKHTTNIKDALRSNSLSGYLDVTKAEFDEEVVFSEFPSEDRRNFYHEAIINYAPLSRETEMPAVY